MRALQACGVNKRERLLSLSGLAKYEQNDLGLGELSRFVGENLISECVLRVHVS